MKDIGHDGTEIILGKPRQFSMHEIIDWLWPMGFTLPEIVLHPLFVSNVAGDILLPEDVEYVQLYPTEVNKRRIDRYLVSGPGLVVQRQAFDKIHAYAWIDGRCIDPLDSHQYLFSDLENLEVFYPFIQIKS